MASQIKCRRQPGRTRAANHHAFPGGGFANRRARNRRGAILPGYKSFHVTDGGGVVPIAAATALFAWVMANPIVTAPIIGASKPEQLDDSFAALEYVLPPDLKEKLDEMTNEYRMGDAVR